MLGGLPVHKGPPLDSVSCALFFSCSVSTPSCALCMATLCLTGTALVANIVSAVYLGRRRRRSSNLLRDPAFQVALADTAVTASLFAGNASTALGATTEAAGWALFHATSSASLAASAFSFLTARCLRRVVVGSDRPLALVADDIHWMSRDSSFSNAEDVGRRSSGNNSAAAEITTTAETDYGLVDFTTLIGVWSTCVASYGALGAATRFRDRRAQLAAYATSALLTLAMCGGIFASIRTVREYVFRTYPKKQARRLSRGALILVAAYAVRGGLVAFALCINCFEPVLETCGDRDDETHFPMARVTMQVLWALAPLVDSLALFLNASLVFSSQVQPSTSREEVWWSSSFCRRLAPLGLVRCDDRVLANAHEIGAGAFGRVYKLRLQLAKSPSSYSSGTSFLRRRFQSSSSSLGGERTAIPSDCPVAVKCPKYSVAECVGAPWLEHEAELFRIEAYRVASLKGHPHVVRLYGVAESPAFGCCLVTEYMDLGSLEHVLDDRDDESNVLDADPSLKLICAVHVARAMAYLHSRRVVHRDLKPGNILLDTRLRFKVSDFGTARVVLDSRLAARRVGLVKKQKSIICPFFFSSSSPGGGLRRREPLLGGGADRQSYLEENASICGSPGYMAPELLVDRPTAGTSYSAKVDCYSYGVVLWNLAANRNTWFDPDDPAAARTALGRLPPVDPAFDPAFAALMPACWATKPDDRPDFTAILAHWRAVTARRLPSTAGRAAAANCQK